MIQQSKYKKNCILLKISKFNFGSFISCANFAKIVQTIPLSWLEIETILRTNARHLVFHLDRLKRTSSDLICDSCLPIYVWTWLKTSPTHMRDFNSVHVNAWRGLNDRQKLIYSNYRHADNITSLTCSWLLTMSARKFIFVQMLFFSTDCRLAPNVSDENRYAKLISSAALKHCYIFSFIFSLYKILYRIFIKYVLCCI